MPMFTADERCTQCGLCAELCPAGIIQMEQDRPFVRTEDEAGCIKCGQCVAFCPQSACFLADQRPEDRVEIRPALMPAAESAETLLRSRRSVRRYQAEALDRDLVARLLETCRYAPTASNSQAVRWVVTADREKTRELGGLVIDHLRSLTAGERKNQGAYQLESVIQKWDSGYDIIFRGAPQVAVAVFEKKHDFSEDAAIALTYFELAAHAHGLGCCWAGFFTRAARQCPGIQKYLGIRDHEMIVGGQMFGRPAGLGLSHILPPRKKIDLSWV